MSVSTKQETIATQVVEVSLSDAALAAVNEALDDPDGFIGATAGRLQIAAPADLTFTVETDPNDGSVSVALPSHLNDALAFTVYFEVTR